MLIGIDATQANKDRKTGTEWYAYQLIQRFKTMIPPEHRVVLYSPTPLEGALRELPPHFSSRVLKWPLGFLFNHLRLSWELLWHPVDVLFIPSHVIPLIHPSATVTTIHDVGFEEDARLYNSARLGPKNPILSRGLGLIVRLLTLGKYTNTEYDYHRFGARFASRHAAKIITVSEFSKRKIQEHYHVSPERITVTYHGHDDAHYGRVRSEKEIQQTLSRYKIARPFFVYIGRLEEKKNTLNLVKAFHLFLQNNSSTHRLVLIGSEGYGYDAVRAYVRTHRLAEAVVRPGYVDEEDVPAIFQAARALVFPSRYEGFGIPILHAFASGTPVIASNAASIPEVVGNAGALLDPDDVEGFARAMRRIVEDAEFRQKLIELGKERVTHFSDEKLFATTWDVLRSLEPKKH